MAMVTEIEPVEVEITPSRKVKGFGYLTANNGLAAIAESDTYALFWMVKTQSNNSRHLTHPKDIEKLEEQLNYGDSLCVYYQETSIQEESPIEPKLKVQTLHPEEVKAIHNTSWRQVAMQIFKHQQFVMSLSANTMPNYVPDDNWLSIKNSRSTVRKAIDRFLKSGPKPPELPALGILKPSPDLDYMKFSEPNPDRPSFFLEDVADTEVIK